MTDQTALLYTKDHEWVLANGDVVTVGITDYAAEQLGDVVYVELPEPGTVVSAGAQIGEIESTKSVGELFSPVDGEIVEANGAVVDAPDTVNADPFGDAWLVRIRLTAGVPDGLMDHDTYRASLA